MINYVIVLMIAMMVAYAGKKVVQSVKNGGCPGCSGNCGCGGGCKGNCSSSRKNSK